MRAGVGDCVPTRGKTVRGANTKAMADPSAPNGTHGDDDDGDQGSISPATYASAFSLPSECATATAKALLN